MSKLTMLYVNSPVLNEVRFLAKRSATFYALVRLCSSVNSSDETGFVAKASPTFTTLVSPFPSVNLLVLKRSVFVADGFSTFAKFIKTFSSVESLVVKDVSATENCPAFNPLVTYSTVKGLPTLNAALWLLTAGSVRVLEKA